MSYTLPGMLSMSSAGAPGKSFTIGAGVPSSLTEIITLGRTLKRRSRDTLAYFDHPHTSNGPTEATNGRLEPLRGSALRFRNLPNYITRALLETGRFRPQLHPQL